MSTIENGGHNFVSYFDSILDQVKKGDDKMRCSLMDKTFAHFKVLSPDGLDIINYGQFNRLLSDLFVDQKTGQPFYLARQWVLDLFKKFDKNGDNQIDRKEFTWMWVKWIMPILNPKSVLIIVDVQNDFINGTLSVAQCPAGHRGEEVVPVINQMMKDVPFEAIVYSYDWHPLDHISFHDNYRKRKIIARNGLPVEESDVLDDINLFEEVTFQGPPQTDQKLWPRHCVQNSWGAKLHPDLIQPEVVTDGNLQYAKKALKLYKGTNPLIDSYSAFWDNNKLSETGLGKELKDLGITMTFVCGLAYDFCVGSTAEHANEYGFSTILINDATRGVDIKSISDMRNKLLNKSVVIVDSDRVEDMARGRERRPEHAYHLAEFLK